MSHPVIDPVVLDDIEAEFMASVYEASQLAERRRRGEERSPAASPAAQALLQRVRNRTRFDDWASALLDEGARAHHA